MKRRFPWGTAALFAMLIIFSLAAGGCRLVSVQKADGTSFTYVNAGFDTSIGELDVQTPNGTRASLRNANSQTQAFTAGVEAARGLLRAPAPTTVNVTPAQ